MRQGVPVRDVGELEHIGTRVEATGLKIAKEISVQDGESGRQENERILGVSGDVVSVLITSAISP